MRLWHDDVRLPPSDEWVWAQNNDQAKALLETLPITICSLDHDLGAVVPEGMAQEDANYLQGQAEETGMQLVEWMIEKDLVPRTTIIHSWNPAGAQRMWRTLIDAGHLAILEPFKV